jgi:hypothetical protein
MGWLTGWKYRKSHVINSASGAGTNYQVRIVAHYGSGTDSGQDVYLYNHCRLDFGDVRFTRNDGTTLLDYWMESYVVSDNAVFWVEIADDLSSASVSIYIYYGKSDATTTSNFDNTFVFGELWTSSTLDTSKWTSVTGSPVYSINATGHYLEVADMAASNWWTGVGFGSKTFAFPDSWIVENAYSTDGMRISHKSDATGDIFGGRFEIRNSAGVVTRGGIEDAWASSADYAKSAVVGSTSWSSGETAGSVGVWYDVYVKIWKVSGNIHVSIDGTERLNVANSDTIDRILLEIARYSTYTFGTERFYGFKIRKYVSPEPAHGAWGQEERCAPVTNDFPLHAVKQGTAQELINKF